MKTLTLLRHAKSNWAEPVSRDFDRPLNARGHKAARLIGRALRSDGMEWDAVIASPAVRVVETLASFAEGYGRTLAPAYDQTLYLASTAVLMERIHAADDCVQRLLVVGHNPGLEQIALMLTTDDGGHHRAELVDKYPTATMAHISLPAGRWGDVVEGSGVLIRFLRPRDLDPELGPEAE